MMKKKTRMIFFIALLCCVSYSFFGKDKFLILSEGNDWLPMLPANFIANRKIIQKLPFNGFVMIGNTFTNRVMTQNEKLKFKDVWNEVKGVKNLYKNKHNFLQVNVDFPGDFWDNATWKNVTQNFAIIAEAAKKLGFEGIVFDDEPYSDSAHRMCNFKFPTKSEVKKNPDKYTEWEKKGSQPDWVDRRAYRNPKYSFKEHMVKVTERFRNIMKAMEQKFPAITVLVYNGPAFAHENTNKGRLLLTDVGWSREHEYKGPMFTGFKSGLNTGASLFDMGESYKYRDKDEFERYYQWRKKDIAKKNNNDTLDEAYHWIVPEKERSTWSKRVGVGFMVFNKGEESSYPQYDTRKRSSVKDIEKALKYALKRSDKYVIYYCQKQDWLLPNRKKYVIPEVWRKMMKRIK